MSTLHPLLSHHIVNSLEWPSLRPVQRAALDPVLAGEDVLVVAPTAGGKTEAALFPSFSRMLEEEWSGLSVLYLCPLRALLNNLYPRVNGYAQLIGRRAGLWHGDVSESDREKVRAEPPDVLLTTPESVEAMLISSRTDHQWLFRDIQLVIVDEIHAFAGDDRGWHLRAVLHRLEQLSERSFPKIGLSATVGDPEGLLDWLSGATDRPRRVIAPGTPAGDDPEITVDHVGSIGNAATVISRLHRGEKRLVFVDSRSRAEQLTNELRLAGVDTWLSHGSLGRAARRDAEDAFAGSPTGVIVATSTMELGIDVGDLDRVIQLDAPWTVASFLQRLGRTGRRSGSTSNCLILTTRERELMKSLGLLLAWRDGWVEPVMPPAAPYHVVVQQILALLRQEGAVGRHELSHWLGWFDATATADPAAVALITDHLLETGVLASDGDLLQIGPEGERRYGRMHFRDLTAVFSDPPTLAVRQGPTTLGTVHIESLVRALGDEQTNLLISGRVWSVIDVDWRRRVVSVLPAAGSAATAWMGSGFGISSEVAAATRRALAGEDPADVRLSQRATDTSERVRAEFAWLTPSGPTHVVTDSTGSHWWWTFAGSKANEELTRRLAGAVPVNGASGLAIAVDAPDLDPNAMRTELPSEVPEEAESAWKFGEVLPTQLLKQMWVERAMDVAAVESVLDAPRRRTSLLRPGPRP